MYPLQSTLETTTERLMKVALLRIRERIQREGFLSFFLRYPGIKQRMKDRRIEQFHRPVVYGEQQTHLTQNQTALDVQVSRADHFQFPICD